MGPVNDVILTSQQDILIGNPRKCKGVHTELVHHQYQVVRTLQKYLNEWDQSFYI